MSKPFVATVMASESDLPGMNACCDILSSFAVPFEARMTPACRTPEEAREDVKDAERRGCGVAIAAVGIAAHRADPSIGRKLRDEWTANAAAMYSKTAALQG